MVESFVQMKKKLKQIPGIFWLFCKNISYLYYTDDIQLNFF